MKQHIVLGVVVIIVIVVIGLALFARNAISHNAKQSMVHDTTVAPTPN